MILKNKPERGTKAHQQWRVIFFLKNGAGSGNRTRIASLEGWSFTTKLCPLLKIFSDFFYERGIGR
jgi:hypothetical protein